MLLTGGHSIGNTGKVEDLIITRSSQPNQVLVELADKKIAVPRDYVFVVGREKPIVSLGEEDERD